MTHTPIDNDVHYEGNVIVHGNDTAIAHPVNGAEISNTNPTMTKDEVFDQLMDETHVVTGGTGSRQAPADLTADREVTGYSAGVGSGSGDN